MKINPEAPAMPLGLSPGGMSYTEADIDYIRQGMLAGINILTVVASQQMAALVGTMRESTVITEDLATHIAKEAVMLSKALIEQLNSEQ